MSLLERWQSAPRMLKGFTLMTGTAATFFGTITAVSTAWPVIEPGIPAHRAYVVQLVENKLDGVQKAMRRNERQQISTQIETVEVRRSLVERELFELDVTLRRDSAVLPDAVRQTLELRKSALGDDKKNLDYRLDQLQRTNTGRRP